MNEKGEKDKPTGVEANPERVEADRFFQRMAEGRAAGDNGKEQVAAGREGAPLEGELKKTEGLPHRWTREEALRANKKAVLSPNHGKHGPLTLDQLAEEGGRVAVNEAQRIIADPKAGARMRTVALQILARMGSRRVEARSQGTLMVGEPEQIARAQVIYRALEAANPAVLEEWARSSLASLPAPETVDGEVIRALPDDPTDEDDQEEA